MRRVRHLDDEVDATQGPAPLDATSQPVAAHVEPAQCAFEMRERKPRVAHRAENHVAGDTGKTVEVGYGHSA